MFYIPPELVWNQQQVAHARTSLAHPAWQPMALRFISLLYSLKKSLLIATLKAWYKYCAMKKQQPLARPKSPPPPPPLQLPWHPPRQQQQGSLSCRPSIAPWEVGHGSFVPCEIVREQLRCEKNHEPLYRPWALFQKTHRVSGLRTTHNRRF